MIRTVIFSIALIIAAAVLGFQVKQVGGGRETISVKGLAEKPIKADRAEWTVGLQVKGASNADALGKLRKEKPALDRFLASAGFNPAALTESNEAVEANYEQVEGSNGNMRSVQQGNVARLSVTVNTTEIGKIIAATKGIVQFEADGHPVTYGQAQFLVSNLEDVKMSLIGAAMRNSHTRAEEFAKNGDVKVGSMRSASQGAFYILPAGADSDVSDWGGTCDKTTVDKIARVVVTVDYGIDR
ncbi:MAG TPA: SIMPL domain-containing protein [Steroidobacteraceae bacterium]|nr:SIMPL domain-containing protein [Steroidobacteraceae bacterium]